MNLSGYPLLWKAYLMWNSSSCLVSSSQTLSVLFHTHFDQSGLGFVVVARSVVDVHVLISMGLLSVDAGDDSISC